MSACVSIKARGARNIMTGIRKSLGLALTMIIVLSLVGPQGASASLGSFHSESGSGTTFLTFTPHGINQLETQGGTIKCSTFGGKTSYSGTTTTELTISSISYGGCIAFGLTAHIDTMGCTYTLTGGKIFANFQIVCPTTAGGVTDEITITPTQGGVSVCHVDIPEQSTIAAVYNVGTPPRDVEIAFPSPTI